MRMGVGLDPVLAVSPPHEAGVAVVADLLPLSGPSSPESSGPLPQNAAKALHSQCSWSQHLLQQLRSL